MAQRFMGSLADVDKFGWFPKIVKHPTWPRGGCRASCASRSDCHPKCDTYVAPETNFLRVEQSQVSIKSTFANINMQYLVIGSNDFSQTIPVCDNAISPGLRFHPPHLPPGNYNFRRIQYDYFQPGYPLYVLFWRCVFAFSRRSAADY